MSRRLAGLLVAVTLLGGCAEPRSGSLGPAPTAPPPSPSATGVAPETVRPPVATPSGRTPPSRRPAPTIPTAAGTRSQAAETTTVELWFSRAGRIAPTRRTRPATVATSRLALAELVAGPSPAEAGTGLTSLVPAGTETVRIADGTATVRVPAAFTDGDAATVRLRQAQVVWTLTQFPTVRHVRFGSAGPPLGRDGFADLLPAIVVSDPAIGRRVSSPVTVAGTADVFEATVTARVLDATGREVGTAFTTATCGSGCRGGYRLTVAYRLSREQRGTVEVYEVSPADGTRGKVVAVPVVLSAAPG